MAAARRLRFWLSVLWETLTRRRLAVLVRRRMSGTGLRATGADALPTSGSFVLAVNHYRGGPTLDVLAAVLSAAAQARPDLAGGWLLVAGHRDRTPASWPEQATRGIMAFVFRRWRRSLLHLRLGNDRASPTGLRAWRERARLQPSLVFPEGRARREFGPIRPGAGRWLATLGVLVVPAGVWHADGAWQVRFGAPLAWSRRPELRDHQLGLAIAALLPAELTGDWQPALARWRNAHQPAPERVLARA